jgi:hypothetical protein
MVGRLSWRNAPSSVRVHRILDVRTKLRVHEVHDLEVRQLFLRPRDWAHH